MEEIITLGLNLNYDEQFINQLNYLGDVYYENVSITNPYQTLYIATSTISLKFEEFWI